MPADRPPGGDAGAGPSGRRAIPWPELALVLAVIVAGAAVYLYAHRDEGRLAQSREAGARIIAALTAYEAAHGTYPETLDELVPEFLPAVEQPTWGLGRWSYRRYTPADVSRAADAADDVVYFRISVAATESGYPVLYYDVAAERWVLNN